MAGKRSITLRGLYGRTEDDYLNLVRQFPLRPLRSDADLDAAVAVIDNLLDRPSLSTPEKDYLDVLSDLVESYEADEIDIRPVGEAELLRFLLEHNDVTQTEIASTTGIAESTMSELLAGKRKLNRKQIVRLARYFRLDPGAFLAEV